MAHKILFLLAAAYTLLLTVSSLLSLKQIPLDDFSANDKILHCIAYFFLAILWSSYLWFSQKEFSKLKIQGLVGAGAFLFGIIIEILQGGLTSYREGDIYDVLANAAGILAALLLVSLKKR